MDDCWSSLWRPKSWVGPWLRVLLFLWWLFGRLLRRSFKGLSWWLLLNSYWSLSYYKDVTVMIVTWNIRFDNRSKFCLILIIICNVTFAAFILLWISSVWGFRVNIVFCLFINICINETCVGINLYFKFKIIKRNVLIAPIQY